MKLLSLGIGIVRTFPALVLILGIAATSQLLAACGSTGKAKLATISGTPADIKTAQTANTNQAKTLGNLKSTVDGLSPANVTTEKGKAQTLVGIVTDQNHQVGKALGTAAKDTAADHKKMDAAGDPVQVRLHLWAGGLIIAGCIALGIGMFLSTYVGGAAPWLRSGGAAAIGTGILVLVVAALIKAAMAVLPWIVGTVLVGVGVWVYLHRSSLIPAIESFFNKAKADVSAAAAAVKKDVA